MCIGMRVGMREGMCEGICICMCMRMFLRTCIGMCIGMCCAHTDREHPQIPMVLVSLSADANTEPDYRGIPHHFVVDVVLDVHNIADAELGRGDGL